MTDTKEPKGTISVKCRELFSIFCASLRVAHVAN